MARREHREAYLGDARVLGSSDFVETLYRELRPHAPRPSGTHTLERLCARVCAHVGIAPDALRHGGRRPAVTRARAGIAYLCVERLGYPGRPLAPILGIHPAAVYQAARRGAQEATVWERMLSEAGKMT